ncbi:MAG: hypothetical protein ACREHD_15895 [Pirellulales bacterium]
MVRFQFSLSTLLWTASAVAFAAGGWAANRSQTQRNEHPLAVSLMSLGLITTVVGALLSGGRGTSCPRREQLATAALTAFIVGIAIHFVVIHLLGTTGALVAIFMKEDAWGHPSIPGVAVRAAWGTLSGIFVAWRRL